MYIYIKLYVHIYTISVPGAHWRAAEFRSIGPWIYRLAWWCRSWADQSLTWRAPRQTPRRREIWLQVKILISQLYTLLVNWSLIMNWSWIGFDWLVPCQTTRRREICWVVLFVCFVLFIFVLFCHLVLQILLAHVVSQLLSKEESLKRGTY